MASSRLYTEAGEHTGPRTSAAHSDLGGASRGSILSPDTPVVLMASGPASHVRRQSSRTVCIPQPPPRLIPDPPAHSAAPVAPAPSRHLHVLRVSARPAPRGRVGS